MKYSKFLFLIALFNLTLNGKAQMTTIYEFGNGTNDSIFAQNDGIYQLINSGSSGTVDSFSLGANGLGLDMFLQSTNVTEGMFHQIMDLPNMALYSNLEFQIEYSLYPNTYQLALFTSQTNSVSSVPNASGNLVNSNTVSLTTIPYSNINGDSVLILELYMPFPDSVNFNINYIKISADTSAYVSVNESSLEEFKIFTSSGRLEINPNEYSEKYQVSIYNSAGYIIYNNENQNAASIPFDNLFGVYIVKVISSNGVHTKKVFIE